MDDTYYMNAAYQEALKAFDEGEVPIGAVIVKDGRVVGRGYNRVEKCSDATAHAEILAIGAAASCINTWRLPGCTLFVTMEPCIMCLGAILQSRIARIVYAVTDPRLGAVDTFFHRQELERAYRYFPVITSGVMQQENAQLLRSFFDTLRRKKSQER
jgi:tRNA(adenine34) deaminase